VSVPKINLLVSRGPAPAEYVMPNLVGQPLGSVMLALQDAGLRVGKLSVVAATPAGDAQSASITPSLAPTPGAASMIVTQNPVAGKKIVAGSAVDFEVR
jgi:beta-lactam-binding protein with PASTA domain